MTQEQMFPLTEEERIETIRRNLRDDVEKRKGKLDAAMASHAEAKEYFDLAQGLLETFDHMIKGRASVIAKGSESIDPLTGELKATQLPSVSVVVVLWPDDEPHVVKVGELTRYSNLVAEYVNEAGLESDLAEFSVLTEIGLEIRDLSGTILADDYGKRLVIVPADAVEAAS